MLTNRPMLVKNVTCTPGISDYDIGVMDSDIKPIYNKPKPREVYKYSKVDWDTIRKKAKTLSDFFVAGIKGSEFTVETA